MFYTIYKITNQIDGKFYIGSHKTKNLNDDYMGSGKYLIRAQEKYGIENFEKDILFVFETADEMYAKEAEIVNEDFLATENTYNLRVGGFGGFDFINKNKLYGFSDPEVAKRGRAATNLVLEERYGPDWRKVISALGSASSQTPEAKAKAASTKRANGTFGKVEQMCTDEAIKKKKSAFERNNHQQGSKNSQYGKMWITNGMESKSIKKDQPIPHGWRKGRVVNISNPPM